MVLNSNKGVITIGWLGAVFKRNSEVGFMFDVEMFIEKQTGFT